MKQALRRSGAASAAAPHPLLRRIRCWYPGRAARAAAARQSARIGLPLSQFQT